MKMRAVTYVLACACAVLLKNGSAFGADLRNIQAKLASNDPAVWRTGVDEFLPLAPQADGFAVMDFAGRLFAAGYRDEALFWFYAGQLRARYMREPRPERAQALTAYILASESINAYAFSDVARFRRTVQKVLAWDDVTFDDWAWEQDAYFPGEDLGKLRGQARDGLTALAGELESKRAEFQKRGREVLAAADGKAPLQRPPAIPSLRASLEPPPPSAVTPFYLHAEAGRVRAQHLGNAEIADGGGSFGGKDMAYWVRRYYEWQEKVKKHGSNVQQDGTGKVCTVGQGGAVWFLTNYQHGKALRSCSVPASAHVLIPVFEVLLAPARGTAMPCEDLRSYAKRWITDAIGPRLNIDGEELKDLARYEGTTGCYEREDRAYGGRQLVATHGYWVMLRPLSPGTYRIEFAGQAGGNQKVFNLSSDVTYAITVTP